MALFGLVHWIADSTGVLVAFHEGSFRYLLLAAFNWGSILNMFFHQAYYCFENRADFDLFTASLGGLLDICVQVLKSSLLLRSNVQFRSLYAHLRQLCADPKRLHFERAQRIEKKLNLFARVYAVFMLLAAVAVTTNPVLVQLIEFLRTGQVLQYRWDLPFPYANPVFDFKASPAYEVIYVVFALTIVPLTFFLVSCDLLFMATCAHISGLWEDLRKVVRRVLEAPGENCVGLQEALDYQNCIYGLVEDAQRIFGSIFFTQCMGALVVVCTLIFVATLNWANGRAITYLVFGVAVLSELLIYTYFGSRITVAHEGLLQELQEADWGTWSGKRRRLLRMMVRQAQRDCCISFLGWLPCSAETLLWVLKNSFNLFALLQNLNRRP